MKVDGNCGPVTKNWILRFQLDCNKYNGGAVVVADNRTDRVRNKNLIGSLTGKYYTLALLNYNARGVNPDAWLQTQYVIPLQDAANVPPPSIDYVPPYQQWGYVPSTGGAQQKWQSKFALFTQKQIKWQ